MCHLHCADICTAGAEAMVSKPASALAQIKGVAPNGTRSHHILPRHTVVQKCHLHLGMLWVKQEKLPILLNLDP